MAVNAALVRLTYPSRMLPRGLALNAMIVAASSVAGPSIAALVLSVASWPWLFLIQVPLCFVVFFLGRKALPMNTAPATSPRLHPLDVVLNIAMFSLVFLGADAFGVREGGAASAPGGGLALPFALLGAAVVVAFFYLRRMLRQPRPLFPVDLLRIRIFALSMCTSVSAFSAQTLAFVALPFLLLEGQGRSHVQAGLLITAWPAAIVVCAPLAGRLLHRGVGGGLLGGVGLALLALGLAIVALLPAHPETWGVALALALCGAGFGIFQTPNNHTIVTSAPLQRAGAASGMLGTARLTGQSLGAVMLALVFSAAGVRAGGPQIALGLGAGLAAAGSIFSSLRIRKAA
jgi:DHA2 family multidrug resistance protein-like MFS transporter